MAGYSGRGCGFTQEQSDLRSRLQDSTMSRLANASQVRTRRVCTADNDVSMSSACVCSDGMWLALTGYVCVYRQSVDVSTSAGQAVISQVLQAASTVLGMAQDDLSPTVTSSVVDIVNTLCRSSTANGSVTNSSVSNSTSLNTGSPLTRAVASQATVLLGIVARLNVANAEAAVTSSAGQRRRLTSTSQSQSQSSGNASAGDGTWVHATVSTIASAISDTQVLNAPTTVYTVGSEADGSLLQVRWHVTFSAVSKHCLVPCNQDSLLSGSANVRWCP